MSGDEAVVLIASLMIGLFTWGLWYGSLYRVARLGLRTVPRRRLALVPVACGLLLFVVLRLASAHDVRDSGVYLTFYVVLGVAWLGLGTQLPRFFGLSARDDVVERGNAGAALAIGGAFVGLTLCFAGGNIGDGPGWWVVVFSALVATAGLLLVWLLLERFGALADQITIERDPAAGLRLAGFLTACGLVLGRAVAGDWVSAEATVQDLLFHGWPVLVLLVIAIPVERALRVTPERPESSRVAPALLSALLYVALGAAHVLRLGPPA